MSIIWISANFSSTAVGDRLASDKTLQRTALYLGEINDQPHSLHPSLAAVAISHRNLLESLEEVMLPVAPNPNAIPQRPRSVFFALYLLVATLSVTAWAAQPDRIVAPIDNNQTEVLKGSVHPKA